MACHTKPIILLHFVVLFSLVQNENLPVRLSEVTNFAPCSYDKGGILDCSNRGFTQVPIFETKKKMITYLRLDGNAIQRIRPDAFHNISTLSILTLMDNRVSDPFFIDVRAFANLGNLVELKIKVDSIAVNKKTEMNLAHITSVLVNLETLDLVNVPIETIDKLVTEKLKTLRIVRGNLKIISRDAFTLTKSLQSLTLRSIPANILETMTEWGKELSQLTHLDISENNVTRFITFPSSMSRLQRLSLAGCQIQEIPLGWLSSVGKSLTHIDLNSNDQLTPEKCAGLRDLTKLRILDLSFCNSLKTIPPVIRNMTSLEELYLDRLPLFKIAKDDFQNLKYLKVLRLMHLNTEVLYVNPDAFKPLVNLKSVEFSRVAVNDVTFGSHDVSSGWGLIFGHLLSLKILSMRDTGIESEFMTNFENLTRLEVLKLNGNNIQRVPENVFLRLHDLKTLDLSGNKITEVNPKTFHGLYFKEVEYLGLKDNLLSTVDNCTFGGPETMDRVNLAGNPFICDCRLRWMLTSPLKWSDGIHCSFNGPNPGRRFSQLTNDQLTCSSSGRTAEGCVVPIPPPKPTEPVFRVKVVFHDLDPYSVRIILDLGVHLARFPHFKIKYTLLSDSLISITKVYSSSVAYVTIPIASSGAKYSYCIILINNIGREYNNFDNNCFVHATINKKSDQSTIPTSLLVGIVIGCIAIFLIALLLLVICLRRQHRADTKELQIQNIDLALSTLQLSGNDPPPAVVLDTLNKRGSNPYNDLLVKRFSSSPYLSQSTTSLSQLMALAGGQSRQSQYRTVPPAPRFYGKGKGRKARSLSVDLLDSEQMGSKRFLNKKALWSSTDRLAENRSCSSQLMTRPPLSLSMAYLNSGLPAPSAAGPLPARPRQESNANTYDEIVVASPPPTYLDMKDPYLSVPPYMEMVDRTHSVDGNESQESDYRTLYGDTPSQYDLTVSSGVYC